MAGSYKVLEKIAIADFAFEAKADTLNEIFQVCARAMMDTLVNVKTVGDSYSHEITLENKDIEKLLYDFLEELIYLKDVYAVVFSSCNVRIIENKGKYTLNSLIKGEKINQKKHALGMDVKAVTLHMFSVKKEGKGYKATVVLDI